MGNEMMGGKNLCRPEAGRRINCATAPHLAARTASIRVELSELRKASARLFEQGNLNFSKIYENFNSHFCQCQKPGARFSRTLDNFIKVNHSGLPTELKG